MLDGTCGSGRAVEVAGGSAAAPSFRTDLADATRRPVSMPRDDDTDHSARGAALIAALATEDGWPDGAFPAAALAAEPDEVRAKLWDELWAAHESARLRLYPPVYPAHQATGEREERSLNFATGTLPASLAYGTCASR